MNIPTKVRGWLYIVGAVASAVVAVLIVLGVVPQEEVMRIIELTAVVAGALLNLLARLNLSE